MPTDTYTGTIAASEHVCALMRRINALEAGVSVSGGTYLSEFGSGNDSRGLAITGSSLYTVDTAADEVFKYSTAGTFIAQSALSSSFNPGGSCGIAIDGSGNVYAVDDGGAGGQGIYKLDSSLSLITSWFTSAAPTGVAVSGGYVYTAIPSTDIIEKYTDTGTLVTSWGTSGSGTGEFQSPVGVAVQGSEVFVADSGRNKVLVFDTSGAFQREWGTSGSSSGEFTDPYGICFDSAGNIYVADVTRQKILVFNSSEVFQYEFGTSGTSAGEFQNPEYVTIDASDYIYVSDPARNVIIKFSSSTSGITQTTFNSYTTTVATSLGTPDGGMSIPSLNGLNANGAGPVPNHILDMRAAIETLAPYFDNPGTGNPYNWTASSADNLYFVAMGDRSAYGATGGAAYDWTRNEAAMIGTPGYGLDIGEVKECIATLEAS